MAEQIRFFIGTYTDPGSGNGIFTGAIDSETGALSGLALAAEAPNPSFLAMGPHGRHLYAVEEARESSVAAFRVGEGGVLTALNRAPTGGAAACHLQVDPSGKFVLFASYTGGSIGVYSLADDGSLGDQTSFVQYAGSGPNRQRQAAPHAHAVGISPDGKFAYACDLGTDKVLSYRLEPAGSLTPTEPPSASVPSGHGVRHLAFGPGGRFLYAVNEMGLSVTAFARDAENGVLTPFQTIPLLPEEEPVEGASAAEIVFHPRLPVLYATTRGTNRITVFGAGADGRLKRLQVISSPVAVPRGFDVDPSGRWAIAAGQADDRIAVLRIDQESGLLVPTGHAASIGSPACVVFAP